MEMISLKTMHKEDQPLTPLETNKEGTDASVFLQQEDKI